MKLPLRTTASTLLALLCIHAPVSADTFTAPLNFTPKTGDNEQYLAADFDFHTQFAAIDSVTLNLTMPDGYEGAAVASGYSPARLTLSIFLSAFNPPREAGSHGH